MKKVDYRDFKENQYYKFPLNNGDTLFMNYDTGVPNEKGIIESEGFHYHIDSTVSNDYGCIDGFLENNRDTVNGIPTLGVTPEVKMEDILNVIYQEKLHIKPDPSVYKAYGYKDISYYVAECMEFPDSIGRKYENLNPKEALEIYSQMGNELHGGKGIGFIDEKREVEIGILVNNRLDPEIALKCGYEEEIKPFWKILNEKMSQNSRLFIDMDGTIAEFKPVDRLETLYEKNYFLTLSPNANVIDGIKVFMKENPDTEVFILSSVLSDSKYALEEKNMWLNEYLPEIDKEHRLFPSCGQKKEIEVPNGIRETDVLLDDYTINLDEWKGKGLKILNGINDNRGSWMGERIDGSLSSVALAGELEKNLHINNLKRAQNVKVKIKTYDVEL